MCGTRKIGGQLGDSGVNFGMEMCGIHPTNRKKEGHPEDAAGPS